MSSESVDARRERIAQFDFRELAPFVRFGTASDRYAGWIGQIYPEAEYATRTRGRNRKLGGKTFREEQVPIDSVRHYFEHFEVLELDFTFYRPLLEADGTPGNNLGVLREYADNAPEHARFLLKAPQTYFVRKLRRGSPPVWEPNPDYLNAEACNAHFIDPAIRVLGSRLEGFIFEQSYVKQSESPSPEGNVAELAEFFGALDRRVQAHLELRSSHLLVDAYFDWLAAEGLGFVFSHWSWLPPIREQWAMCGKRFSAANERVVARLLTPLRMSYADAYALSHPFDKPAEKLEGSRGTHRMVMDATALAYQGLLQGHTVDLILNNRAYGNSPMLGQLIAGKILDEEVRRFVEGSGGAL
ncbi:MAG: DUF72 domain-containing protein [Rhodothermales bacterium]|nr:DUF72 domain-containing protein [Rhodothermales bacterium]MBO6780775.1 DUF72 domain-containing protein [Rhodothermales bacterium]